MIASTSPMKPHAALLSSAIVLAAGATVAAGVLSASQSVRELSAEWHHLIAASTVTLAAIHCYRSRARACSAAKRGLRVGVSAALGGLFAGTSLNYLWAWVGNKLDRSAHLDSLGAPPLEPSRAVIGSIGLWFAQLIFVGWFLVPIAALAGALLGPVVGRLEVALDRRLEQRTQ
jgi:hypothetical protein